MDVPFGRDWFTRHMEVLVGFGTVTPEESLMIQVELTVALLEDP